MSSRRRKGERGQFHAANDADDSLEAIADAGYGTVKFSGESRRIVARKLGIDGIIPNPSQPRRAIPSSVRHHWDGQSDRKSMTSLFQKWIEAVEEERGGQFEIDLYFDDSESIDYENEDYHGHRSVSPGSVENSLLQIVDLSASILRNGLTNPITIAKYGQQYVIETGERRWLAYHLLYAHSNDEQWSEIPARIVEQYDVWRQATENAVRDDLNAIGKARQLAILLMELYGMENFTPFSEMIRVDGSDRSFYAQVSDGNTWRIPRGEGERLLNAVGLKHAKQLRDYRALLRLSDKDWVYADDHNITEGEIRKSGYTVPHGAVSSKKVTERKSKPISSTRAYSFVSELEERYIPSWRQLNVNQRLDVADRLEQLANELRQSLED